MSIGYTQVKQIQLFIKHIKLIAQLEDNLHITNILQLRR